MRNVYVIFSSTDLKIGKMIRVFTRNQYNHCSLCLSEDMQKLYSFSRIYHKHPLIGGFVAESPCRYTLSSRTIVKIVEVPVTESGYQKIANSIRTMSENDSQYVYNFFSFAAYIFGKSFERENAFTCAEFVNRLLKQGGVKMPEKPKIDDMETALANYPTWEGRAVDLFRYPSWGSDKYLMPIGRAQSAYQLALRFSRLCIGHLSVR